MVSNDRVCADCGVGLRKGMFTTEDSILCYDCKCRIINEVNTPGMDKAISLLFTALVIGAIAWVIF